MKTNVKPGLATMELQDMFGLWWDVTWVRGLVLSLIPIGVVDSIYTALLLAVHGPQYEYNPLVRWAFTYNLGSIWMIVNIVSFALFAMLAGSYYLHTRNSVLGNKTRWLSLLLSIRVGTALYNVLLFYWVRGTAFFAMLGAFLLYIVMDTILNRDTDVSIRGFKRYVRAKYDRFHDALLTRGISETPKKEAHTMSKQQEKQGTTEGRNWGKTIAYLLITVMVFVSIPFVLTEIARLTGALYWNEVFGNIFYWNYVSGPTFMIGFFIVLGVVALAVYFIFKAFDTNTGAW